MQSPVDRKKVKSGVKSAYSTSAIPPIVFQNTGWHILLIRNALMYVMYPYIIVLSGKECWDITPTGKSILMKNTLKTEYRKASAEKEYL